MLKRKTSHGSTSLGKRLGAVTAVAAALLVAAAPHAALAEDVTNVMRLYNRYDGDHLFTTSQEEYDSLEALGWTGEGVTWLSPSSAGHEVYRLYNKWNGEHFLTTDARERDGLIKIGWSSEGTAFDTGDENSKGSPVYRLYNPWLERGTHLFTMDKDEYDHLGQLGWHQEGIAFRTAETYIVYQDGNGGKWGPDTFGMAPVQSDPDGSFTLYEHVRDWSKPGYAIASWNTKPDGSGISYPIHGAPTNLGKPGQYIVLYAQWVPGENYDIDFTYNGSVPGDGSSISFAGFDEASLPTFHSIGVINEAGVKLPTCPYRAGVDFHGNGGYTFVGWNTKADGTGVSFADGATVPSSYVRSHPYTMLFPVFSKES